MFFEKHAGKFAKLYRNSDGKYIYVGSAKIGSDGKVLLKDVKDKGDYVVMLEELSNVLGDMNNDGILNALDASAILKDIVGIEKGSNPAMADYNCDGIYNALDASAILKKSLV